VEGIGLVIGVSEGMTVPGMFVLSETSLDLN